VSAADDAAPVSAAEAKTLFASLARARVLILAVSGGPDSTALLWLAVRWRRALKRAPKLVAVTVDHGLRPASAAEARAVGRLARALRVPHRTLRWQGDKPATGLQRTARAARYRLIAAAARRAKALHVLTAHTLDDQAETVLIRMSRGSGMTGLGAMAKVAPLPAGAFSGKVEAGFSQKMRPDKNRGGDIALVRPLLDIPKARLVATLARAGITFADDPSNRDPRFTRARLRGVMPTLAREGLDAHRLALLARRMRRADAAIEAAVDVAAAAVCEAPWSDHGPIVINAERFARLPEEVALRLLGRAIAQTGDEGVPQLGKLEALLGTLGRERDKRLGKGLRAKNAGETARLRRTLGGALVTLTAASLVVERAPERRRRPAPADAGGR
jgi:tRNA(Ile)-lysidine synthase